MDLKLQNAYEKWLILCGDNEELINELNSIKGDEKAIEDRFYRDLEFGTGGLRGVMGAGTNRMNIFTVSRATQGICNYLNSIKKGNSVAIAFDSRNKSHLFAKTTAGVFAANGISVKLYKTLMPTPALSFAVRDLGLDVGVNITASHNPAKYNGYKLYGADGCQITTDAADKIYQFIEDISDYSQINMGNFDEHFNLGMISIIGDDTYNRFLDAVFSRSISGKINDSKLKLVYSPLNGAGNLPVREVLGRLGINNIQIVKEQELPDGDFPTCSFPNPEERAALSLALALADKTGADLVLATDPDCDRVGAAARNSKGEMTLLTGNQTGVLLLHYILSEGSLKDSLPKNPVIVKTIVTTDMVKAVAKEYGAEVIEVLTGFKFIGEQIGLLEKKGEVERYVFGFEESYGYLSGTYVRDKDAVVGSMLICEMAEFYKSKGKTLIEALDDLYDKYGYFAASIQSFEFDGKEGQEKIQSIMANLRENPMDSLAGSKTQIVKDYSKGIEGLPKSDVLSYATDICKALIRPSGTEPKLKVYYMANAKDKKLADEIVDKMKQQLAEVFK